MSQNQEPGLNPHLNLRFHAWSHGDASVGKDGQHAEIILEGYTEANLSPAHLESIREHLEDAFAEIWSDDVEVLTNAEAEKLWAAEHEFEEQCDRAEAEWAAEMAKL